MNTFCYFSSVHLQFKYQDIFSCNFLKKLTLMLKNQHFQCKSFKNSTFLSIRKKVTGQSLFIVYEFVYFSHQSGANMFLVVSLNNNEIDILKPDAIVLYLFIWLSYLVCILPYDIFQFVIYLISNHILCHVKQEIIYT